MRRKSTGPKQASNSFNALHDIEPEKLQTFAAIIIVWNYIETFLEASLGYATNMHPDLFPHVSSRINGIDGKIAIFKEAILIAEAAEPVRLAVSKTLNAVVSYKKYRDGIVHVKIPAPAADVADTIQRRGIRDEVLISKEALTALYEKFCLIQNELNHLFHLMHYAAMGDLLAEGDGKRRYAEQAEQALAQLQAAQRRREAHPPLPKFPDELQEPPSSEAVQELPG